VHAASPSPATELGSPSRSLTAGSLLRVRRAARSAFEVTETLKRFGLRAAIRPGGRARSSGCDRLVRRYQHIAELTFEDMDALQAGLGSEQGQAAVNDIPNFATGGVTIFFAEID
jgi:uncharacterized protein (TIGR02118 family)